MSEKQQPKVNGSGDNKDAHDKKNPKEKDSLIPKEEELVCITTIIFSYLLTILF